MHLGDVDGSKKSFSSSTTPNKDELMSCHREALRILASEIITFLQTIMLASKFDPSTTEVYGTDFLPFFLLALFQITKRIESLNEEDGESFEEMRYFCERIQNQTNGTVVECPKMTTALKIFELQFTKSLQKVMLRAGFAEDHTNEIHCSFLNLYSKSFIYLCKMYFRYRWSFCSVAGEAKKDGLKKETTYELVAKTKKYLIFYASNSMKTYCLKSLIEANPSEKDLRSLTDEFAASKSVHHSALRQAIKYQKELGRESIILEWADGYPLNALGKFNLKDFLHVAREIVSCLLALHDKNILHLRLSCEHVIFNEKDKSVKLIGCKFSKINPRRLNFIQDGNLSENDLRYASPEQLGLIKDDVDEHSDFYSLGVIFYKMLSGKYPFVSKDSFELIRKQILSLPVPLNCIDSSIPVVISKMVEKLMMKSSFDRYHSARGILYDLEIMINEIGADFDLRSFTLAQHDFTKALNIPRKLYGRSTEFEVLCSAYDKAALNSFQCVCIEGVSGTGKSRLTFEFFKYILKHNGFYAYGKFDASKVEPYAVISEAGNSFCAQMLLKDAKSLQFYKEKLLSALGEEIHLLMDLVKNLDFIIGPQRKQKSDSFGKNAKNMLNFVLLKFFIAASSLQTPFVLILEDCHWIDTDCYEFLCCLLNDRSVKNFTLILTYRKDHIDQNCKLLELIRMAGKFGVHKSLLQLQNLSHEDINNMLSETLNISSFKTYTLTEFMYRKTEGNPLHVVELLKSLYKHSIITFCQTSRTWNWETLLQEDNIVERAVDLIRSNIQKLEFDTQQALIVASVIGSPFSLKALNIIINNDNAILDAIESGMITSYKGYYSTYCFSHDQIQRAALALLPENSEEIIFYIASKLWKKLSSKDLDDNIFTIVKLFIGAKNITHAHEDCLEICKLFLEAGKKAIRVTSYEKAFEILKVGIKLIPLGAWKKYYDLKLEFNDVIAKAAYCNADEVFMNEIIRETLENANPLHGVYSFYLRIRSYNDKRKYKDAIEIGLQVARGIGLDMIEELSSDYVNREVEKAKALAQGKSPYEIPTMKILSKSSKSSLIAMILNSIITSCYFENLQLLQLVAAKIVQLTFEEGILEFSATGLCALGIALCNNLDGVSMHLGKLGLGMLERMASKELYPNVYMYFYASIYPRYAPVYDTLPKLLKSYGIATEVGNMELSLYCANCYCHYSFYFGVQLNSLLNEIETFADRLKAKTVVFLSVHQAILNLIGDNKKDPAYLIGEQYDYRFCSLEDNFQGDFATCHLYCMILSYLFKIDESILFLEACEKMISSVKFSYDYPIFLFYKGLILLDCVKKRRSDSSSLRKASNFIDSIIIDSKNCIEELSKFSSICPQNFLNKVDLMNAELAAINKEHHLALTYFKHAIELSSKNHFVHEEAISCERLGMYLLECGEREESLKYLTQSVQCFHAWGASAKVVELRKAFHSILENERIPVTIFDSDNEGLLLSSTISQVTENSSMFSSSEKSVKRVRFQ